MAQKAIKTSVFTWEGTDRKGSRVKGELSGASPALVKAQLRKQGVNPLKVRKKSVSLFSAGKKDQADGHRPVHSADGDHDEGGRASAAVVRHYR